MATSRTATKVLLLLTIASVTLHAQPSEAPEHPAHAELRAMRTDVIAAITAGDIDRVLSYLHPDVVVTWQNSEVCRGREGVRDFFQRMGRTAFRRYKVEPTPDELTILHGDDTGISFGRTVAEYTLLGRELEFESRWTATLVKEDGRWLLAGYHISMNALDNPLLNGARRALYASGAAGLVGGAVAGFFLGRRRRR